MRLKDMRTIDKSAKRRIERHGEWVVSETEKKRAAEQNNVN